MSRRLEAAVAVTRSPFTSTMQIHDWGGEVWAYDVQIGPFTPQSLGEARATVALLTKLRGPATAFLFEDPTARHTGGLINLGDPQVNGGSQTGSSLVTDGWTPGILLKAGMCFSLGTDTDTRMHMLTEDVVVDASGNATLPIAPSLRTSPADNATVEWDAPKVKLRLTSPVPTQVVAGAYYTFSFSAVEAI